MPDTLTTKRPPQLAAGTHPGGRRRSVRPRPGLPLDEGAGHTCGQAASAEAAWDYLHNNNDVQLVVLDVNMPGRSGLELLDDIKIAYPETAVLMMTALGEAKTAVQALTHGASGYLGQAGGERGTALSGQCRLGTTAVAPGTPRLHPQPRSKGPSTDGRNPPCP